MRVQNIEASTILRNDRLAGEHIDFGVHWWEIHVASCSCCNSQRRGLQGLCLHADQISLSSLPQPLAHLQVVKSLGCGRSCVPGSPSLVGCHWCSDSEVIGSKSTLFSLRLGTLLAASPCPCQPCAPSAMGESHACESWRAPHTGHQGICQGDHVLTKLP